MRIVFMGTPDYSVPTVTALKSAGHSIEAVFCQPDKPVGRKQIITAPPVKVYAQENGIPVYQLDTLRDGTALSKLTKINPDIIVVVAYGKILPKEILSLPKHGCINGHASILPKLRGASPIQWAIVTGEKQTGVTVMQMDEGMDTGDILAVERTDITDTDTSESLFYRLSVITADLITKTIGNIENGKVTPIKQDESKATYAPIIKKEMAHLDFSKTAKELCCLVRGLYSWPVAFCSINGKRIKVYSARECKAKCGEIGRVIENNGKLVVSCFGDTAIEFIEVQPEGGKRMTALDMLRGNKIDIGTVIE